MRTVALPTLTLTCPINLSLDPQRTPTPSLQPGLLPTQVTYPPSGHTHAPEARTPITCKIFVVKG